MGVCSINKDFNFLPCPVDYWLNTGSKSRDCFLEYLLMDF